jgi:hypothetical protein
VSKDPDAQVVERIENCLRQPVYFRDILDALRDRPYRAILRAWSEVRTQHVLERDDFGRYSLPRR